MSDYVVIVLRDENGNIEKEINLRGLANAVLKRFAEDKRYWRDPALEPSDLEQEIYLRLLEDISTGSVDYDPEKASFSTWLYMKASNYVSEYLRHGGVVHVPEKDQGSEGVTFSPYLIPKTKDDESVEVFETSQSVDDPEEDVSNVVLQELLTQKAHELLDPVTADMLLKYYWISADQEWTQQDLADFYSMTQQAVDKRLRRALNILSTDNELQDEMDAIRSRDKSTRIGFA